MLNENIKKIRIQNKISQIEMACKLNITRQAYNHYETGRRIPPLETLQKISDIFNVTTDFLLEKEEKPAIFKDDELMNLSELDKNVYKMIKALSPDGRKAALKILEELHELELKDDN